MIVFIDSQLIVAGDQETAMNTRKKPSDFVVYQHFFADALAAVALFHDDIVDVDVFVAPEAVAYPKAHDAHDAIVVICADAAVATFTHFAQKFLELFGGDVFVLKFDEREHGLPLGGGF